jgi:hypothetical protein
MSSRVALLALLCSALALGLLETSCASTECNFNSQCGRRHYCFASSCRQDCALDTDCTGGLTCSLIGRCEAPVDGAVPLEDLGPRVDLGRPDLGPTPVDLGPTPVDLGPAPLDLGPTPVDLGPRDLGPAPVDLGTPLRPYLADCTLGTECASGQCVPDLSTGARVCSKTCTVDSQCADWHFCVQATLGAAGFCAWDDTGRACTNDTSGNCAFACLSSNPTSTGHCTHLCRTAADCAGGYGCVYSAAGDPTSPKVCAWTNRNCPTDATECPTSLGVCGGLGTWCTGHCTSAADCPRVSGAAEACTDPDGLGFNYCQPSTSGGEYPLGTPCSANTDCRSGICAVPEPGSTAVCLERCTPTSGCPAGFGCNAAVLSAMGAANICVPAGLGRSGTPCTQGRQCRSGACSTRTGLCIDSCQNGFCPPSTVCTPEGLTVEGISLSSCR